MNYAYIRVSSADQKIDRQVIEICKYDVPDSNIFIDYQSGKDFERKEYQRLKSILQKNDVLYIKSIDRLGRNYKMITDEWRFLTELEVEIIVLDMPILNTKISPNALISNFINDIVLQILSFVAQNEREVSKARQREGIEAAKLRGVRFGRPFLKVSEKVFKEEFRKFDSGQQTLEMTVNKLKMCVSTFYKYKRMYNCQSERRLK